ncbi:MAG: SCO family protein [Burkholderiaceae bacterium]
MRPIRPTRREAMRRIVRAAAAASTGPLLAAAGGAIRAAQAAPAWLPPPRLPDASLVDHLGRPQRLRSDAIQDQVVLVHFFFTGCAATCPPQTALLRDLRERLDARPPARPVRFVGVSVDPLGDGPAELRAYLQRFSIDAGPAAGWIWLTGAPRSVASVLDAFGVGAGSADAHPNLLWIGDAARGRWTRTAALQSASLLAARVEEVAS